MSDEKVLVPILKPSAKSTRLGKQVAKHIRAGKNPAQIGKNLARQLATVFR